MVLGLGGCFQAGSTPGGGDGGSSGDAVLPGRDGSSGECKPTAACALVDDFEPDYDHAAWNAEPCAVVDSGTLLLSGDRCFVVSTDVYALDERGVIFHMFSGPPNDELAELGLTSEVDDEYAAFQLQSGTIKSTLHLASTTIPDDPAPLTGHAPPLYFALRAEAGEIVWTVYDGPQIETRRLPRAPWMNRARLYMLLNGDDPGAFIGLADVNVPP